MLKKIKNQVEVALRKYSRGLKGSTAAREISPFLFAYIRDFIQRQGKRIRPILFSIGYLGFSKKPAPGLYQSALSIELLHDFMLVHDDIIDKSDMRRKKPSIHKMLNDYLSPYKKAKFNGQDLAIVIGDVMYALGIELFLSIKEDPKRKETALKQLIKAALFTGSGEFIELLYGIKELPKIKKEDVYKLYDYKTAYYSFSSPLAIGSTLAGAGQLESKKLIQYGIRLGRAFQIKDDILGMFAEEKVIGKSSLSDLQEAKKTILIWHAYQYSSRKDKSEIEKILAKKRVGLKDLARMRKIITHSGSLDYARKEILASLKAANAILLHSKMHQNYKAALLNYAAETLKVN